MVLHDPCVVFVKRLAGYDEDDGVPTWYDLTSLLPHGLDRNLAPGGAFIIVRDITTTYNTAIVTDAIDIFRNPANRPWDEVPISSAPTAVELLCWRAESVSGRQVRLAGRRRWSWTSWGSIYTVP